jgi:hypothetical protein
MSKKTSGKLVKLLVYRHESEKVTIVDTIEANDWGDFLIVAMDLEALSSPELARLQEIFEDFSKSMQKRMILMPKRWDVEFYGIEKEPE